MSKASAFTFKLSNMKLVNSVVFFIIIWATQCLVNTEKSVSFEQHVQVQQELSVLIATYVKENLPNLTNFHMHSVYTKTPKKGLMDAYFNYSFTTPVADSAQQATTELSGVATLRNIKSEPNQEWALEKIQIEGESVAFTDPVVITAEKNNPEADSDVPKTEKSPEAPKVEEKSPEVTQ